MKKHLHTGRTAKFVHWNELLVLPGFELHQGWRMGVSVKKHLHTGRTAKFVHRNELLVLPGFELHQGWRLEVIMLNYLAFNAEGKKVISRVDGFNKDMLMDITVYQLKKGKTYVFYEEDKETALLLIGGAVDFHWEARIDSANRESVFTGAPYCLHVCRNTKVTVHPKMDTELLVQSTYNERSFTGRFYEPEDCKIELMGDNQWEGTAKREVLTIFDYKTAPYSKMVLGEVITKAGRWSSYIPHSHTQPEVYYYKFDKPQGFGACFIGDTAYKVTDGCAAAIKGGLTHPQVAAPGYNMYYCWMIRHLDNNPWTSRDNDPEHEWLLKE